MNPANFLQKEMPIFSSVVAITTADFQKYSYTEEYVSLVRSTPMPFGEALIVPVGVFAALKFPQF